MNGLNFDRINPQFNSKLRQLSAYYFKRGIKWSKRISDIVNGRESFKYPSNFFVSKKIWEDKNGYLKRNGTFWEADSFHCIYLLLTIEIISHFDKTYITYEKNINHQYDKT